MKKKTVKTVTTKPKATRTILYTVPFGKKEKTEALFTSSDWHATKQKALLEAKKWDNGAFKPRAIVRAILKTFSV